MKNKNRNRKKNILIVYGVIIVCCLVIIIYFLVFYKFYKLESRIEDLNKFESAEKEKAIGWIKVQGTNIDMPIIYNNGYVDLTDPTYDIAWTYNDSKKQTSKINVYSHNMRNVSSKPLIANKNQARFEQLMSFIYTSFIEDNKYIQYTVDGKNHMYKIYAISFVKTEEIDEEEGNLSENYRNKYINERKKASYFKFDTKVSKSDNLLTLITCTRFFGATESYSFVVDAREVRKNEKIRNYEVRETNKYKPIKKILKGDVDNE